jgi:hypothetical protein
MTESRRGAGPWQDARMRKKTLLVEVHAVLVCVFLVFGVLLLVHTVRPEATEGLLWLSLLGAFGGSVATSAREAGLRIDWDQ